METPGIPLTRWFDAALLPKDQVAQKDNVQAMFVQGHASNSITRIPESLKGSRSSTSWWSPIRIRRPGLRWRSRPAARTACTCCRSRRSSRCKGSRVASNRALQWGEQIVKPIFEFEGRSRGHVPHREEARLRRQDVQEHQGREQPAGAPRTSCARSIAAAGRPATAASRRSASSCTWRTRRTSTCSRMRATDGPGQGRLLRPAMAVLGHAGSQASGHAAALQHQSRTSWTAAARSARASASSARKAARRHHAEGQPAGRGLLLARTPRSRTAIRSSPRRAQEARLGQGPDAAELAVIQKIGGDNAGRRVVVDRSLRRHPARRDEARLHALRQRQGAHERVRPAGSDPGAPRADLHAARRSGREISDAARRQAVPAAEYRLLGAEGGGRQGHRQAVPAHPLAPAAWSNTKAAAKRRAPTRGSPNCSRTCSSRSIRPTPPSAASRTAAGSG